MTFMCEGVVARGETSKLALFQAPSATFGARNETNNFFGSRTNSDLVNNAIEGPEFFAMHVIRHTEAFEVVFAHRKAQIE